MLIFLGTVLGSLILARLATMLRRPAERPRRRLAVSVFLGVEALTVALLLVLWTS